MRSLATALNSPVGLFYRHSRLEAGGDITASEGISKKTLQDYETYYAARNVWLQSDPKSIERVPIRNSHRQCSRKVLTASEFYCDFLKPLSLSQAVGATVGIDDNHVLSLGVVSGSSREDYGVNDESLLAQLAPYVARCVNIKSIIGDHQTRASAYSHALDRVSCPAILTNSNHDLLHLNSAAEKLIYPKGPLKIELGRISLINKMATDSLSAAIKAACNSAAKIGNGDSCQYVAIEDEAYSGGLRIGAIAASAHSEWLASKPTEVMLFVAEDRDHKPDAVDRIRRRYGLTKRECEVVALIGLGLNGLELSRSLGISYQTFRVHLKNVFSKTGVRSQTELARIIGEQLGKGHGSQPRRLTKDRK